MAKNNYSSLGLIILILFILCLAAGFFLTKAAWNNYSNKQNQLTVVNAQNKKLVEARDALQAFLQTFSSRQQDVTTASLALPINSDNMADFLNNLNNYATQGGVTLSGLSVTYPQTTTTTTTTVNNTIHPVPISFSANGSYAALKGFITRLESSLRLTDVNQISVIAEPGTNTNSLQYQIKLNVYYQQ
jgi:Tfp pilus assembly protein PilO